MRFFQQDWIFVNHKKSWYNIYTVNIMSVMPINLGLKVF